MNGQSGYFSRFLAVYGQADRPCPRCGKVVKVHDALCTRCGQELEFPEVDSAPPAAA